MNIYYIYKDLQTTGLGYIVAGLSQDNFKHSKFLSI